MLFDHFEKRSLCINRITGQQFKHRIFLKEAFQMLLQTAGLVGFVAAHRPLIERHFEIMHKDIEHENGIVLFVEKLMRRLAVDGGNDGFVGLGQDGLQKVGEGILVSFGNWFAIFRFRWSLPGCLSVSKTALETHREFFERTPGQGTRDGCLDRRLHFFETERGAEDMPVFFRPAISPGDVGKLTQKSEKNQNDHPVKMVPNSFGVTGIGDFVKNVDQLI